jgi:hypothetical protein
MSIISIEQYLDWMRKQHGQDFVSIENINRFNTNIKTIQSTIANSPVIHEIEKKLHEWALEYELNTQSSLFMKEPSLQFITKSYESVVDKTFRINALWNKKYPNSPPKMGWITPDNIFSNINDLVRTYLVCKFIDGPKFLTEKLEIYCNSKNMRCECYSQERDEGYYAYHFYLYDYVDVLDSNWKSIKTLAITEIQLTTQLQEVLKDLTHQYFEVTRLEPKSSDNKWKWEVGSNRFRSAYMCHTLHLLEAIILDLRDTALEGNLRQKGNENETKSADS